MSIVLIIERTDQAGQPAAELLKAELGPGYFLHSFSDGAEALRFLANVQPDAVLIDLDLPAGQVTGPEALAKIKALMGLGKVAVASDIDSPDLTQWLAGLGVGRYLLKPYNSRMLAREIRGLVG